MGSYSHGGTSTLARGDTLAARWLHEPQPISDQPVGSRLPHRAELYRRPGGSRFTSPGCCSCRDMGGFLVRGWDHILPVCGGTSTKTVIHEPQSISDQPIGLGFPHRAEQYRTGGSPFSSPCCWICRRMGGFLIRGWIPILSGVRQRHIRTPANQKRLEELGFPHSAGKCRPGETPFLCSDCRSCKYMEGFLIQRWDLILPGVR